jgi:lipoyl(octanoyl) transferase
VRGMTRQRLWEFRYDPPATGAANMRIDGDLLRELDADPRPRTILRFYTWRHPTLSLGRNQSPERAADLEFCRQAGIEVVSRPTGGQAVLHDDELTYAVISNEPDAFGGGSVYGTYRRVSEALGEGYRRLGVGVDLVPVGTAARPGVGSRENPCFVSQSRYELTVGGRKIAGSAQRRLRRAFLQHGSMPLSLDRRRLARVTRFDRPDVLEERTIALVECLSDRPDVSRMVEALTGAFRDCFDVALVGEVPGSPEGRSV